MLGKGNIAWGATVRSERSTRAVCSAVKPDETPPSALRAPPASRNAPSTPDKTYPQAFGVLPARRSAPSNPHPPALRSPPASCSAPRSPPSAQDDEQPLQALLRAAFSVVLSSALAAQVQIGVLAPPAAAFDFGKPRLTEEERVNIRVFNGGRTSVVSVTNFGARQDDFTTNVVEYPRGMGSGFVWDKDGHIVTNFHVVTESKAIMVLLKPDGKEYVARLVGTHEDKDVALLQVDLEPQDRSLVAPVSKCSSSAGLAVGQKVYAIGYPFGLDHTLTTGVVSGMGREISALNGRPIEDVIQIDAAINPGNSGGPLLDSNGCVIGVNTAIFSPTGTSSGVGFAIPIDVVKGSVEEILRTGRVVRPMMGVILGPTFMAEQIGVQGVVVLGVVEGGPGWQAGLRGTSRSETGRLVISDVVTAINGRPIKTSSDVFRVLDKATVGDVLDVELRRNDEVINVAVTLQADDAPLETSPPAVPPKVMPLPSPTPEPLPLPRLPENRVLPPSGEVEDGSTSVPPAPFPSPPEPPDEPQAPRGEEAVPPGQEALPPPPPPPPSGEGRPPKVMPLPEPTPKPLPLPVPAF